MASFAERITGALQADVPARSRRSKPITTAINQAVR